MAHKELEKRQQLEQHEQYVNEKRRLTRAAEEKMKRATKITEANKKISKREIKDIPNKTNMTKSKGTSQKAMQRAAKAIDRRVEQLEVVATPIEERPVYFHQPATLELHNPYPIMGDRITLTRGGHTLLEEVSFQFPLETTIALTGKNGSGKTSLLEHIWKRAEGTVISPKAAIGMYEQMSYQFQKKETVMEYIQSRSDYSETNIRAVLSAMDFTGNDVLKDVRTISGGEAIRLVLCELFLGRYNILLLDEPTNFLDIHSVEALEQFIASYKGTIVIVSHDRRFIERTAERIYTIEDNQLHLE